MLVPFLNTTTEIFKNKVRINEVIGEIFHCASLVTYNENFTSKKTYTMKIRSPPSK